MNRRPFAFARALLLFLLLLAAPLAAIVFAARGATSRPLAAATR